jgi:hypothetical protein
VGNLARFCIVRSNKMTFQLMTVGHIRKRHAPAKNFVKTTPYFAYAKSACVTFSKPAWICASCFGLNWPVCFGSWELICLFWVGEFGFRRFVSLNVVKNHLLLILVVV